MLAEPLKAEIQEKVKRKDSPFAIFDFDNTCIVNDIGEAAFAYMCRNHLLEDSAWLFKRYFELYDSGNIREAYLLNARMFAGLNSVQAEDIARKTIEFEGNEIGETSLYGVTIAKGLAVRPEVMALMHFLKECGVSIWIVSASNEVAVKVAMEHFGISANLIGVRGVQRERVFSSEVQTPMPIIDGKVECLREYISPTESPLLVIDDSTTGLPILETGDIKVAVNRGEALMKIAEERGWYVL